MIARTQRRTVEFRRTLLLKGVDRILPAGKYDIVSDKLIEGLSFPVCRRVSTFMFVPSVSRVSAVEMVAVKPHDLQAAQDRDAGHRHRRRPAPKTANRSSGRGEPVDRSCRVRGQGGNHNNTDRIRPLVKTDAYLPRRAAAEFAATEAVVDDPEMPWMTSFSSAATAASGRAQAAAVAVIAPEKRTST